MKTDIQSKTENINEKRKNKYKYDRKILEIIRDHKNIIESSKTDIEALKRDIYCSEEKQLT